MKGLTREFLIKLLIERWNQSGRMSVSGRAIVISVQELNMIVEALSQEKRDD